MTNKFTQLVPSLPMRGDFENYITEIDKYKFWNLEMFGGSIILHRQLNSNLYLMKNMARSISMRPFTKDVRPNDGFSDPSLPTLCGIVRIREPPSTRTSAMSRKNSRNLVYVKSKNLFLLLALFYNWMWIQKEQKAIISRHCWIYHWRKELDNIKNYEVFKMPISQWEGVFKIEAKEICFRFFFKFRHPDC